MVGVTVADVGLGVVLATIAEEDVDGVSVGVLDVGADVLLLDCLLASSNKLCATSAFD